MMEEILQAYGLLKESIIAIMMLYENTKAMDPSPDGLTNVFDISANVRKYVYILPRLHILKANRSNKSKWFLNKNK